jgi:subtilisin family serine protease
MQRGTNSFSDKVTRAMNAGAIAAIIYNNVSGDFRGTLSTTTAADGRAWIPAVSVSNSTGATLKKQAGKPAGVVNQISSWDRYDGTSMATAHVTGIIALVWSAGPTLSNTTVESYLFSTCTDLGTRGYDTTYGRGIVNASAAVAKTGK